MEDSLFDKIEDLTKEDARLDQKIGDEIDRAKGEEVTVSYTHLTLPTILLV